MDAFSLLRMLGALLLVLGMLVCALWAVKRYDLILPRKWLERIGTPGPQRRLQVVERLAIDQRRSVVLLRRDDTEFSVLIGPEGVTVLDSTAVQVGATDVAQSREAEPEAPAAKTEDAPPSFAERIPVLPDIWFTQEPARPELH